MNRNKWIAALMGLAMPGLGQIYNGELIKGISFFIILEVVYVLGFRGVTLLPDGTLLAGAICVLTAVLGLYAAAIFDAYGTAAKTEIAYQRTAYNRWYFYIAVWLLGWVLVSGAVFRYVQENLVQLYSVPTGSMEPAIRRGDHVIADKTAYRRMAPKKGDIVIFLFPNDRSKHFIKRVEGLPGETITMSDGTRTKVPQGSIYVLGDNKENSLDSRHFGFVPLSDVIGKARQVY